MLNRKKLLIAALASIVIAASSFAQEQKNKSKSKTETNEEIIIKKSGKNPEKMTIVVDGDNVTINGKPVDEFENNNIIILKKNAEINMPLVRMRKFQNRNWNQEGNDEMEMRLNDLGNKAMLGVLTEKTDEGVKITEVTKNSGAEKAGLKEGDIITKVGTSAIASPQELMNTIREYKPKDKVDITYKRDGKENKTNATLGENKGRAYSFNMNGDVDGKYFGQIFPDGSIPGLENFNFDFVNKPKIGLQIQDVEEGSGVKVKEVDEETPAEKAGLKEGDVITQVNGKDISGVDEMKEAIKDVKAGDSIKLTFKRNGLTQTTDIKIPKKLKTVDL